jgi:hypothetical protein
MANYTKATLLALAVLIVAVPVVASMDRSDLAIPERPIVADQASLPSTYVIEPSPGSDLPEAGHLILVGSVLIGLAAAVRRSA